MIVIVSCDCCQSDFNKKPAAIKRTNGNFCSKLCFGLYRQIKSVEAFFDNCKKVNECLLWKGSFNVGGYGKTRYMGKVELAHRVAYMITIGDIEDGMCICHKCDTPLCVNPEHLFEGTHQDNMDDMVKKGRSKRKTPSHTKELENEQ